MILPTKTILFFESSKNEWYRISLLGIEVFSDLNTYAVSTKKFAWSNDTFEEDKISFFWFGEGATMKVKSILLVVYRLSIKWFHAYSPSIAHGEHYELSI